MARRSSNCILTLALTLAGFGRAAVAAEPAPTPANPGDNATLKYWIAFEALPNLSPEEERLLPNFGTFPMGKAATAIVNRSGPALDVLRQAAQIRSCDWGLIQDGPNTLMPHLPKARKAAQLACLRAKFLAGRLDNEGAVSDLLAVLTLARQIGAEGPAGIFLTQQTVERLGVDAAADCLTRLPPEQLKRLAAGLDALPERRGFREAVLGEQAVAKWWSDYINALDDEGKEDLIIKMLRKRDSDEIIPNAPGQRTRYETRRVGAEMNTEEPKLAPGDVSAYTRGFDKAQEDYQALAEMGSLPLPEFDRQATALQEKMKTDCPFAARFLFGTLPRLRYADADSEARMAMLKAAIAVVLNGPDRLKDSKDPFGDGPFEYSKVGEGFVLKSKLMPPQGNPSTLSVSAPP